MIEKGTDLIKELGELAFATRLKRLAESLQQDVARIYNEMNIDFEPKWFTMLYALYQHESMNIGELSALLRLTHPAIIQFAEQMRQAKLIELKKDKNDARKKILKLTAKGKQTFEKIRPVLREIEWANRDFIQATGSDVLSLIEKMETALEQQSMYQRVKQRMRESFLKDIEIIPFSNELKADFKRLNYAWLQKYFEVEPIDEKVLSNPKKEILDKGGQIFFARLGDKIIGTCAIKKIDESSYELLKMAVDDEYQSLGIGRQLAEKAIDFAHKKKAENVELDTSRKLAKAIRLYESLGFQISNETSNENYARCTIKMRLDLKIKSEDKIFLAGRSRVGMQ